MTNLVTEVMRHYANGLVIDDTLSIDEKLKLMDGKVPSPLVKVTWKNDSKLIQFDIALKDNKPSLSLSRLPDSSGFICFEADWKPDNCILLDANGNERMRLTVPWQMTGATNIECGQAPTSFENISAPYDNPDTGEKGSFGVTAHVEGFFNSKFYFELDYTTGDFLWCKSIRD